MTCAANKVKGNCERESLGHKYPPEGLPDISNRISQGLFDHQMEAAITQKDKGRLHPED